MEYIQSGGLIPISWEVIHPIIRKWPFRKYPYLLTNHQQVTILDSRPSLNPDKISRHTELLFIFPNYHFSSSFRMKLEHYEQSCAVDSVTKKCAGSPSDCRSAILGILGTDLRTTCACKGTDTTQLYECLGWQRLLWVNPCVGE